MDLYLDIDMDDFDINLVLEVELGFGSFFMNFLYEEFLEKKMG